MPQLPISMGCLYLSRTYRAPDRTSVIETLARATRENPFDTGHRRANPFATGHRVAPYTPTPQDSRPPRPPCIAAQDIMFLCCNVDHRPEGAERAMLYTTMWDPVRNRWLEHWHCSVCGLTVGPSDVPPFPHWHIFDCPSHGRHTVVVDGLPGSLARLAQGTRGVLTGWSANVLKVSIIAMIRGGFLAFDNCRGPAFPTGL